MAKGQHKLSFCACSFRERLILIHWKDNTVAPFDEWIEYITTLATNEWIAWCGRKMD